VSASSTTPPARRMRRPARAVAALSLLAVVSGGLSACSPDGAAAAPDKRVGNAVDNFQEDNNGAYTLSMDLGTVQIEEIGFYSVLPDDAGVQRTYTGGDYDLTVRYLRRLNDVWIELPDTAKRISDACFVHGNIRSAARKSGVDAGDLPLVTPAVEVVLTLENGREEDGELVADASLGKITSALGFKSAKKLKLPKADVAVPVRVTIEDGRLTGWSVSMDDVVAAMADSIDVDDPPVDPYGMFSSTDRGELTVTFSNPGEDRDFSAPPRENWIEAKKKKSKIARFADECRDR